MAESGRISDVPAPAVRRPLPGISDDTRLFRDGCRAHQLLIQRCSACGMLRHPPGPMCSHCHSFDWDVLEASGRGSLHSFVVMHCPEVPRFDYLNLIGLVELEEGTRLPAGLVNADPAKLEIGIKLRVMYRTFDDGLVLPMFEPA